jgi:hypothetical protein
MVLLCSVCVPDLGPGFTTSLVMVLLCSVCVSDSGPGFTTSLVMVLLCSVWVPDPGPVVNPGPGLVQAHKLNTIIP